MKANQRNITGHYNTDLFWSNGFNFIGGCPAFQLLFIQEMLGYISVAISINSERKPRIYQTLPCVLLPAIQVTRIKYIDQVG